MAASTEVQATPWSGVKHTLIALEVGGVTSETEFSWDGVERFFAPWNADQTLASVEGQRDTHVFAFNLDMPDRSLPVKRVATVRAVLGDLGLFAAW